MRQQSLIGARLNNKQSKLKIDSTDLVNTTPAISLISLDVPNGQQGFIKDILPKTINEILPTTVDNINTKTNMTSLALCVEPTERLTGLTTLSDGSFIGVTTVLSQKGHHSNLLFFDGKSSKSKKISGFKQCNCNVENLLAIKGNRLIAVVSLCGGIPPFDLVEIDLINGKIIYDSDLSLPQIPPDMRLSNLALAPDGKIYATTISIESFPRLVQLDLDYRSMITGKGKIVSLARLTFDNKPLQNDLLSLTFSPSGELYALANLECEKTNSLFSVDIQTGNMKLLSKVAVDKIIFSEK
jgi:hypothetical protein